MAGSIRENSINTEKRLKSRLYSRMPYYIFSNDLFENWVRESLKPDSVWIDAGCGINSLVHEFESFAPLGTGIDITVHPDLPKNDKKFINSGLEKVPLNNVSVDLIISNMVVEHIENIDRVLNEFNRILKNNGSLIFRTTNRIYPSLLVGHLIPKKFKDKIIYRLFGVKPHDIFKTTYPLNTVNKIKKTLPEYGFKILKLEAVEDLHLFHPLAFEISNLFYKVQKLKLFSWLRNCIVCWAVKSSNDNPKAVQ